MAARSIGVFVAALVAALAMSQPAAAHCDTTKGPVVTAARAALEAGDVGLVLHWVRPEDETAIKDAFQHATEVRALGPAAQQLADRYFFETLVRIHRAGEGAPYTGLTDADPEAIIAATDEALDRGFSEELEEQLVSAVRAGLAERFDAASAAKEFGAGDVSAGRAFVATYVPLTHWVEGVLGAAQGGDDHHAAAPRHDASEHAAAPPPGHVELGPISDSHGRASLARHLPWLLTGLFAMTALIEGTFLMRKRREARA